MGKKILWLGALMVLALLISACGQATSSTPTSTSPTSQTTSTSIPSTITSTATTPLVTTTEGADVPKYGGIFTEALTADPTYFDGAQNKSGGGALIELVYQQYMGGDWLRGPAGSGVMNLGAGAQSIEDNYGPQLAESWTMPKLGVWVLKIRQGVHWQNPGTEAGKLMNGREMTAADIVSSFKRLLQPGVGWASVSQPAIQKATTVNQTGPWEVTIYTPLDYLTSFTWFIQGAGYNRVYPPDVVAKYGDLSNWRNAVGTGPYMLTDYVPGSQLVFVRNPNYWGTDPTGPGKGNQLPYPDEYHQLIIPDLSTRQAAFRTGKLDDLNAFTREDYNRMIQANPQMKYVKFLSGNPWALAMNITRKDKPFSDLKVRQAMMYATNFNAWKDQYYLGDAEIDVWPVNKQTSAMYTPLSEMPAAIQDLYVYNPDKAKQLLKEAGYPNGFKLSVVVPSVSTSVDEMAIFADQWSKVGISLSFDLKETAVYNTINGNRTQEDLVYRFLWGNFPQQLYFSPERGQSSNNPSYVNDPAGSIPEIENLWPAVNDNVIINMSKSYEAYKLLKPIMLAGAYYIVRPTPYTYNMWNPWLKNFYGSAPGSVYTKYAWIDQDLKKSLGK
jgi:peptide/nickel transport system substrate-binding protein